VKRLQIISGICICICGMFLLSGCKFLGPCGLPCDEGFVCNEDTRVCDPVADPCEGVTCDDGDGCTEDSCVDGECVFTSTCEEGEVCENDECVNLCEDVNCDDGDACTVDACNSEDGSCTNDGMDCGDLDCVDGECVDLCTGVDCDDDEACTDDSCSHGACSNDDVVCEEGFACEAGECIDACEVANFECNDGFFCVLGKCHKNLCFEDGKPTVGCLDGFHCNPATKECDPDDSCSAVGKFCRGNKVCIEAECVNLCRGVECEDGKECDHETGECVDEG